MSQTLSPNKDRPTDTRKSARPHGNRRPTARPDGRKTDRGDDARGEGRRERPRAEGIAGLEVRRLAVEILGRVLSGRRTLDEELDETTGSDDLRALDARDRGLLRAILASAFRHRGRIEACLKRLLDKPVPEKSGLVSAILHVGATQILHLDVPDRAAVSLAVTLAEADQRSYRYKGMVNAVLRRMSKEREELLAGTAEPWRDAPVWLFANWQRAFGEEAANAIAAMHRFEPNLDITVKADADGWAERLGARRLGPSTLRLPHGAGRVDQLAGYDEGAWWIQDAAASIPARLLGDVCGLTVADLCAAPGGKTAQLAAAGAKVTAMDISERRLRRLSENLARLGLEAEIVTGDLLTSSPGKRFDAILLDAPCSATGTIRRHPEVAWTRTQTDVADLAARQGELLARTAGWLKPGGTIVYCTCSLEPQEGEAVVAAFLAENSGFTRQPIEAGETGLDGLEGAITPDGDLRTLPSLLGHDPAEQGGLDGFFAARLRRVAAEPVAS
uniref:RsmB/NOP family class I SAM-dependent RNA methyltransferase n=1 Tax=Stappia sp. TaxID=1870903 RepID=UPI003BA9179B